MCRCRLHKMCQMKLCNRQLHNFIRWLFQAFYAMITLMPTSISVSVAKNLTTAGSSSMTPSTIVGTLSMPTEATRFLLLLVCRCLPTSFSRRCNAPMQSSATLTKQKADQKYDRFAERIQTSLIPVEISSWPKMWFINHHFYILTASKYHVQL